MCYSFHAAVYGSFCTFGIFYLERIVDLLRLYWSQIFSSDYFYLTVRNIFVSSEHFYSC